MTTNWVKMTKGDEEKLVHPGNVNNHLRFGWALKNEQAPDLSVSVETPEGEGAVETATSAPAPLDVNADAPDLAREAALAKFGRVLESARKHPKGICAKTFDALQVNIQDPPGPAGPWPVHVLMANTIDALAKITKPDQQAGLIAALFGKSAEYARSLVESRKG